MFKNTMAEPLQIIHGGKSGLEEYVRSAEPVLIVGPKPTTAPLTSNNEGKAYKHDIVWRNIAIFVYLHVAGIYGLYAIQWVQWKTILWTYFIILCCVQGTGSGVHRLWAHRSYRARLPLRIVLAICQTICLQNHIYEWCRDHRGHHKFTDTDADPHNANRGFFFSHMGWLLTRKHPKVIEKGSTIDLSDLAADPVVMFQKKYYLILAPLCAFIFPTVVPWYFWGEDLYLSWYFVGMFRYTLSLHGTWLVNSAAHIWGMRPYDNSILARENKPVSFITMGEGWHNYHHIFPWDYRAGEITVGNNFSNFNARFIEFMARIGQAYDLKSVSSELVDKRSKRTGDGTRIEQNKDEGGNGEGESGPIWGWEDIDMNMNDKNMAHIEHRRRED